MRHSVLLLSERQKNGTRVERMTMCDVRVKCRRPAENYGLIVDRKTAVLVGRDLSLIGAAGSVPVPVHTSHLFLTDGRTDGGLSDQKLRALGSHAAISQARSSLTVRIFASVPVTALAPGAATALAPSVAYPSAQFAATRASCSLAVDNLLTARLVPGFRYNGPGPRTPTLAT
jgi:hypothetical protein